VKSETLASVIGEVVAPQPTEPKLKKKRVRAQKPSDGIPRKRGRPRKVPVDDGGTNAPNGAETGVSKSSPRKRKAKVTSGLPEISKTSNSKAKAPQTPPDGYEAAESSSRLSKGGACNRCREKKIKCDGAKPTCNQCRRGLWMCH
jgi:hypothetical protein